MRLICLSGSCVERLCLAAGALRQAPSADQSARTEGAGSK